MWRPLGRTAWMGLVGLFLLGAAGQELPEGVTPEMVEAGRKIYHGEGICFSCHMPDGVGGPLAPRLADDEWLHVDGSLEQIAQIITSGVPKPTMHPAPMPPKGGSGISDEGVREIAAYIWTLSHGG